MDKFIGIESYLFKSTENKIALSFSKIEQIIGCNLCNSAYQYKQYWHPSKTHILPNIILSTGYEIEYVDMQVQQITLVKPYKKWNKSICRIRVIRDDCSNTGY